MKKSAEGVDNPTSRHPHTYSKQHWCDGLELGDGGVTVEGMCVITVHVGGRSDNWRVMSDNTV